jgi:hypothetical protein
MRPQAMMQSIREEQLFSVRARNASPKLNLEMVD